MRERKEHDNFSYSNNINWLSKQTKIQTTTNKTKSPFTFDVIVDCGLLINLLDRLALVAVHGLPQETLVHLNTQDLKDVGVHSSGENMNKYQINGL